MSITLFTSGSTDKPKEVSHSWEYINNCADISIKEIGLNSDDRVLDVFPGNTIAHYTITAYPAIRCGANLFSSLFTPYEYIEQFKRIQPTYIALIPRHLELLEKTKGFKTLDMTCVRYMVTGSNKIEQKFIDTFRERGVQLIANWYGMTELPPPVMIGYNSTCFSKINKNVTFTDNGECIIDGYSTGDLFDTKTMEFIGRQKTPNGKTWKNNF